MLGGRVARWAEEDEAGMGRRYSLLPLEQRWVCVERWLRD